nr:MAG TPA: hypothetical protein [Bacteriophage sp.]
MSDNELIIQLQTNVLNAINSSQMPLMVKALVIENVLLKLNAAVKEEVDKQAQSAQESVETRDEQAEKE